MFVLQFCVIRYAKLKKINKNATIAILIYNINMKSEVLNLIKKYPIENIENAYVQAFLNSQNIIVVNNKLLLDISNDNSEITQKIITNITIPKNIYELERIFELLIPPTDKKINGAFYTPNLITNYMANELIFDKNVKLCDPSCGCGAFLIAAIEKIHKKYGKPVSDIIAENIYGSDIAEYSIRRCKVLLSLLALLNNQDKEILKFNLFTINSLSKDINITYKEVINNGGFDIIIGNPPYVKYQDLSKELREDLIKDWETIKTGNYNLYFAFFELGMKLLKKDGVLGYIVPNNYFTSLSGINLRNYLQNNHYLKKIIDFTHIKVFDVRTYTCITFLQKRTNSYFEYERIDDKNNLNYLPELKFSKNYFENLNPKKWRLLKEEDINNIRKIENMPYKLKDLVDIRVGIATCKDNIYFIDGTLTDGDYYLKDYNKQTYKIEKNITKKISKISDFIDEKSFKNNMRRIIFPYKLLNNKVIIIKENELKIKYPYCYKYLQAVKSELLNRDKGQVEYPTWYAYARTQGLNFEGKKLLTPTFSDKPRFMYDNENSSLFCNGYGLFEKNTIQKNLFGINIGLPVLQKILNSSIMDYYINRTSVSIEGGYPCYQKNFIELFGIPELSFEDIAFIENANNENEIEEFLIKKYDLIFDNATNIAETRLVCA